MYLYVAVCTAHNTYMKLLEEAKRGLQIPWSWSFRWLWTAQCEFWEQNSGPPQEQEVFSNRRLLPSPIFLTSEYTVNSFSAVEYSSATPLHLLCWLPSCRYSAFPYFLWVRGDNEDSKTNPEHRLSFLTLSTEMRLKTQQLMSALLRVEKDLQFL